ncbi:hypothetical protein pdam_00022245 [Pocillopora damicornis]|uniref:G-protein coupled receptors family 1 profile domain-containing protein n=1 Tax=Pocillopora damicornis TaxID=46731 RepID=A0A3M6UT28_POCDA|nr:hypothetical protein pdam_00022245 [Pocillopora damicornis]
MMTFKTSMKTSYLVATDAEQAVDNSTNYTEMEITDENTRPASNNRKGKQRSECSLFLHTFSAALQPNALRVLTSMFFVVYNLNSRDRTLAKQLRFNQPVARAKTQNTSAVKWVALITCVFLSCYGIMIRCSSLFLNVQSCDDFRYKIPLQVINSGINPIVYAFFKRDIKQECKRLLFKRRR